MQNRDLRDLEDNLIKVLNDSSVIMEGKKYVLLSVLRLVEKEADKAVFMEVQQAVDEANANAPIVVKGNLNNAEST